jgi:hypothetical protein
MGQSLNHDVVYSTTARHLIPAGSIAVGGEALRGHRTESVGRVDSVG